MLDGTIAKTRERLERRKVLLADITEVADNEDGGK
jgi:hypothetical protein